MAKGNPGYPGEIWLSHTNCDDQWNVWTKWEATVRDDPAGSYVKNESVHWWFGRWHAGFMIHRQGNECNACRRATSVAGQSSASDDEDV